MQVSPAGPILCWLQTERQDKLRLVASYNLRLDERQARKTFVQARDLLNLRHYQASALLPMALRSAWEC